MMRRSLLVLPSLACLSLVLAALAWAQPQPSGSDLGKLIAQDAKYIQDTLAKPTLDKKSQRRVRMAAVMIAQYAQAGMGKENPGLSGVRDRALELLKAVEADKLDDAKKLAESLASVKGAGKNEPIALEKHLDFEAVMRQFSSERVGGFALEKTLDDLADLKGPVDADQAAKIQVYGHKVAMLGRLAQAYFPPETQAGKKTKKAWAEFVKDMQVAAIELGDSGKTKEGAAINKAAQKLTATCTRCHDVFR